MGRRAKSKTGLEDLTFLDWRTRMSDWIKGRGKEQLGNGVVNSSQEATSGCAWKVFYLFQEVSLGRVAWGTMKRLFFETVAARASATSDLVDVSLVYWKTLAHFQAEFIVSSTGASPRQHGANKNEWATLGTLKALPFSRCELFLYVFLPEVNEIKSPELTHQMDHEWASSRIKTDRCQFIWIK